MGAYLSGPITEKHSSDDNNDRLHYGASSMQGWRISQEDAHNCLLKYDDDCSFFGVYDGHGGSEVAEYASMMLPDYIKNHALYKEGKIKEALIEGFMGFDATLIQPEVLQTLKGIAAGDKSEEDNSDSEKEVDNLCKEANMPLEELIPDYKSKSHLPHREGKFLSPALRSKRSCAAAGTSGEAAIPFDLDEDSSCENKNDSGSSHAGGQTVPGNSSPDVLTSKVDPEGQEATVDGDPTSAKGEVSKALVNGELSELHSADPVKNGKEAFTDKSSADTDTVKTDEECSESSDNHILTDGVDEAKVNGDEVTHRKGKGKCGPGQTKGKSPMKNSEGKSKMIAELKERKRQAAIRAQEIYRQMQEGKSSDDEDDDDDDADEEEMDDNFEEDSSSSIEGDEKENDDSDEGEEEEDEEEDDALESNCEDLTTGNDEPGYDSGCTACVALIRGNELYVANVGDSRCVVCSDGVAVDMSTDHKPEDEEESSRIVKAGGTVTSDGRVNGGLNLSRAIGDHCYKLNAEMQPQQQMISPQPDVCTRTLTGKDQFMVVACDGIWNSMSSQEVCDFINKSLSESDMKLSAICEKIFDNCLAPNALGDGTGCDNMTCVIVTFDGLHKPGSLKRSLSSDDNVTEGGAEEKKRRVDEDGASSEAVQGSCVEAN